MSAKGDEFTEMQIAWHEIGLAAGIEKITSELEIPELANERKALLLVMRAAMSLGLEITNIAITDCNEALMLDRSYSIAYFIKGVAYLWNGNEEAALSTWYEGLENYCGVKFYFIMYALINNGNIRSWLNFERFNLNCIIEMTTHWSRLRNFTEAEDQSAFNELKMQSAQTAIVHFGQIISASPKAEAFKGRGIANCLAGDWQEAVNDLTKALSMTDTIDECLKFRAFAYNALGKPFLALRDITQYEMHHSDDEEGILFRARLEAKLGHSETALNKFRRARECNFENQDWLSFAQVLCDFGMFKEAEIALSKYKCPHDHSTFYTAFLIHKGLGDTEKAKDSITKAVDSCDGRSYFLSRIAAEFFFDIGDPKSAISYYEDAYSDRELRNETEVRCCHAAALMTSGDFEKACELSLTLAQGYMSSKTRSEYDSHTSMRVLGRTSEGEDLFRQGANLYQAAVLLTKHYNNPITAVKCHHYPDIREINLDKVVKQPSEGKSAIPELGKMIEDADRLGSKFPTENKMLKRALGFCVLRIAGKLRSGSYTKWQNLIDDVVQIVQFADWRKHMKDSRYEGGTPMRFPTYYIIKNAKPVPAFAHTRKQVYTVFKEAFPGIHNIYDIFGLTDKQQLTINETFDYTNEKKLPSPTLSLLEQGAFGYDIILQIRQETDNWRKYSAEISELFTSLVKDGKEEKPSQFAKLILLVWLQHSIPHYSKELGHVILHALYLAFFEAEVSAIPERVFYEQLVSPKWERVEEVVAALEQKPAIVEPASIAYWDAMPTIAAMIALLNM